MRITAGHITSFDGGMAWWVPPNGPEPSNDWPGWDDWDPEDGPFWKMLDRPCATCGGSGYTDAPGCGRVACPDCGNTGRHTFEVEVECDNDCIRFTGKVPGHIYGSNWPWVLCQTCMGTMVIKHRVSVVPGMVLPIVKFAVGTSRPRILKLSAPKMSGESHWLDNGEKPVPYLRLPTAAAPGMWCVQLQVTP